MLHAPGRGADEVPARGAIPSDGKLAMGAGSGERPGGLFLSADYFDLHSVPGSSYYRWVVEGETRAVTHFSPLENGVWRSPGRGTYAGWAADGSLGLEGLGRFMDDVESDLRSRGAKHLEVLLPPMAHDPADFSRVFYLMSARGWATSRCDLNQSIDVDQRPFVERVNRNNKKRLRRCHAAGVMGEELPAAALSGVHETLAVNRASKGRSLSMTIEQLRAMQEALPEAVVLFGASREGELVAAAVCLRLDTSRLYVFAWGHRPEHAALSPVVSVAERIYSHCQERGIKLLDIGTSTVGGHPDLGLLRFKQGLDCVESLKLRMTKDLR